MNKMEIAYELLSNTRSALLKDLIQSVISNIEEIPISNSLNEEIIRFQNCLTYIEGSGFNIKGWSLIEIPIYFTFCFADIKNNKFFDLDVYSIDKVIPKYVDESDIEREVETIQIAINRYEILQTHIADNRNN
ncbi:hypothetical protein ACIQZG_22145 [Lysinibacillus sp. NPDC096418]|uniref:hypothetical protein n=1 Tax=Lysinibacillus sp. NPDC096418 TaxID=3364138 RepID=UPI0038044FA2